MRPDDPPDEDEEGDARDDVGDDEPEPARPPVTEPPGRSFRGLEVVNPDDFDEDEDEEDEDEDDADEEDDFDDDARVVLITGASGNIGRKLRAAWEDVYDLVLLDRDPDSKDAEVILADLSDFDEGWTDHFHGVDTVIHLAANPNEFSTWEELERPNLDALCNVFQAAALAGVERVIFASSNHVMGDYRQLGDMPITVDLAPRPDGPYGATKLMGERLGKSLALAFDIDFIALRLGWIQPGENRPDTLPDEWARAMWLSNRDLIRLFECAVEADLEDELFVVVNGMSNNRGMRWDISRTADVLGYSPADDAYAEEL